MIRVALADDHAMVRDGLKRILEASGAVDVMVEAETGEELLAVLVRTPADVCIVDLSMPGIGGLQAISTLHYLQPQIGVIAISFNPPSQYAVRAIQAGASAYITKESSAGDLVAAVRAVASGERYITPDVQELLVGEVQAERHHSNLSNRELAVLIGLAQGNTLADIAREIGVSAKTVTTYRARMMRKLDLETNAEVIQYAMAHHLVSV